MNVGTQQIEWTDELSVGVENLDNQHKWLIDLINNFGQRAISPASLIENLGGVIDYAAKHFNDEEAYLKIHAADLLPHQIDCHAKFIKQSYDFALRLSNGEGDDLRQDIYSFLCDWLIRHIQEEDQQYHRS